MNSYKFLATRLCDYTLQKLPGQAGEGQYKANMKVDKRRGLNMVTTEMDKALLNRSSEWFKQTVWTR